MTNALTPKDYYHVCSEGTRTDLLFKNEKQFTAGMNIIAQAVADSKIQILVFCIMDNHFHFLVRSTRDTIKEFTQKINHCYFVRRKHWSTSESAIPGIKWDAIEIKDKNHLLNAIAYILRNPMDAYYNHSIFTYKWSSAMLYFQEEKDIEALMKGYPSIKMLKPTRTREILGTRSKLPEHWLVTQDGFIWPGSYIDHQYVEGIYGSFHEFLYYMSSKKECKIFELQYQFRQRIAIPDWDLKNYAITASETLFNKSQIQALSLKEKKQVADWLIRKYGCTQKQIFRIINLDFKDPEELE